MKFHVLDKSGHREEVSPLEYARAPMCKRNKFMQAVERYRNMTPEQRASLREEKEARRAIRLHEELEGVATAGLRLHEK